ncbi:MAG: DUF2079 domain-containing protein [Ardenticatenaceae bacterium]|nr:DUF2079 domain-containing protein [Ardenticatenaceae bacterium]
MSSRLGYTPKIISYLLLLVQFSSLTGLAALFFWRNQISINQLSVSLPVAKRIVALVTILYLVAFGPFVIQRHIYFNSSAYDLGIYQQVIWNTAQGNWFASSFEVTNRMADHFQPLVAILAPLYWLFPSPIVLLVFQTAILASGAIPVFLLAQKILKNNLFSVVFVYLYLFYPALGYLNRFDFHWESTVVPLFLWAILAVEQEKRGLASLLLFFALFGKEDVGLTVAAFGIWVAFTKGQKNRGFGISWSIGGVLFSLLAFLVIIPFFNEGNPDTLNRYVWMGNSPDEIVLFALNHPIVVFRYLFSIDGIRYLFSLLGPLFFLPLLGSISIVALPAFAYNGLSTSMAQKTVYFHYTAPMIPFMVTGAIFGARNLIHFAKNRRLDWIPPTCLVGVVLFTTFHFWGVNNPLLDDGAVRAAWDRQPNQAEILQGLALIPNEGNLFTTNHYAVHKANRTDIQIMYSSTDQSYLEEAEYFFLNLLDFRSPEEEDFACNDFSIMLKRAHELNFDIVYYQNHVLLLEKSTGRSDALQEIAVTLCP